MWIKIVFNECFPSIFLSAYLSLALQFEREATCQVQGVHYLIRACAQFHSLVERSHSCVTCLVRVALFAHFGLIR